MFFLKNNFISFYIFILCFLSACDNGIPSFPQSLNGGQAETISLPLTPSSINTPVITPPVAVIGIPSDDEMHTVSLIGVEYQRVVNPATSELTFNIVPITAEYRITSKTEIDELEALLIALDTELFSANPDQAEIDRLNNEINAIETENNASFTTESNLTSNRDLLFLRATSSQERETLSQIYLTITNQPDEINRLQGDLMDALVNQEESEIERILTEMDDISMTTLWEIRTPFYDRVPDRIRFPFLFASPGDEISSGEHVISGIDAITDDGLPVTTNLFFGTGTNLLDRFIVNGETTQVNNGMVTVNGENIPIEEHILTLSLNDTIEFITIIDDNATSAFPDGFAIEIGVPQVGVNSFPADFPNTGLNFISWSVFL